MLCWAYDTMITNAYVIFGDMPQSPDAITHKEFRLQCAWGGCWTSLNLTSLPVYKAKIHPVNVKEDTSSHPQIKFAVDVVVVRGGKSVAASKRGNAKRQGLDYHPDSTTLRII